MTDEQRPSHAGQPGHPPTEDDPQKGFATDEEPFAEVDHDEPSDIGPAPHSATVISAPTEAPPKAPAPDLSVLDVRPTPGPPREYHFPSFERSRLDNGLTVLAAHLPGRRLLAAMLVMPGGGSAEQPELAGVSALTGRALTEGTKRLDAIGFIEASERLGAELHAESTWEALNCSLEVPRSRFRPALALLADMALEPRLPAAEIERLREERLNDLLQARADPRRRAERVFPETIYDATSPYARPLGGVDTTVSRIDRDAVVARHADALDPSRATVIVAGDLDELDIPALVNEHFGGWQGAGSAPDDAHVAAHPDGPRVVLVDRPGSPQSEIRIGHIGLGRRTPDFHAVSVLNAIVGGTFGSRLNRLLREEKGWTYGVHSSFDMRRAAGPFVVRVGVQTEVTVEAIAETMTILRAIRGAEVGLDELTPIRDYLVGVFPLRFEGAAPVAAALAGLTVFELPDDELDRYRPAIAAVTPADVLRAARAHIRPDDASIVVVGDAANVEAPLREANFGALTVVPPDAPPANSASA
jgi:zinc protease